MSHADFDVVTGPSMAQRRAASSPQRIDRAAETAPVTPTHPTAPTTQPRESRKLPE